MDSQCLSLNLDEQDALNGNSSIGRDDVIIGGKMLDKKGENRDELILGKLPTN